MSDSSKLVILGAGGFAREVLWLVREMRQSPVQGRAVPEPVGFVSGDANATTLMGLPILGDDAWAFSHLDPSKVRFVCAIGDSAVRRKVCSEYAQRGFQAFTLIHPNVRFSEEMMLGAGSILCAGAMLTTQVKVGSHTIVNLNATVGHDVTLGDFVTLHPGAHVNGNAQVGNGAEIGSGAVILPGCKVGAGAVIGAGAVVTEDMPEGMVCMGVPCRPVRPV